MTRIYLSPPQLAGTERTLIEDALSSGWLAPLGPHVDAFERELAAVVEDRPTAATSSGTAALHLALELLGVSRGDFVYTSTLTFVATANAIRYVGAVPVFLDSDAATWTMDPDLLAEALADAATRDRLPKAVVAVDIYGQCADYDRIAASCAQYGVPLIEDAAESLGATYRGRPAGAFGSMAVFSFNGNKIITTSGGGMLVAENRELVDRARFLATQARDPAPHYQHSTVGYNYRMSNLLAAVGRAQLAQLPDRVRARRAINERYRAALGRLPGIEFMPLAAYGESTCWLTCITIDPVRFGVDREHVRQRLEQLDIESRPVWKPMHLQPVFADSPSIGGDVSERLFEAGLCLPSGSQLTGPEQARICEAIDALART